MLRVKHLNVVIMYHIDDYINEKYITYKYCYCVVDVYNK